MPLPVFLRKWSDHQIGLACAMIASVAYGASPTLTRAVYADGGNMALVLIIMTWARVICMGLYCKWARAPVFATREDIKQGVIGGIFQTVSSCGLFLALLYIPAPLVIVIIFTHTIMLLLFTAWRGEIKLDRVNITATLVALGGLTLVLDLWHIQQSRYWIGVAFAFMSALAVVSRMYVYGHQTRNRNPIVVGFENFSIAALLVLPVLFFQTPHLPATMIGFIYAITCCLTSTLGSFCMFYGISKLGSFQYSLFSKLEPIFTSLFSVLILKEVMQPWQYIGIAIVVGSLLSYQMLRPKPVGP